MNPIYKPSKGNYRGRFAPSPTGPLHMGSMFTALASFLQAKSNNGSWLLRIDDIDTPRICSGASSAIMRTLERHGLCWDEGVFFQRFETEAYYDALNLLDTSGWLYPCHCSRKELAILSSNETERTVYPGICRKANRSRVQPHALRVLTKDAAVTLEDKLQGSHCWDVEKEFGDFIVLRRDKIVSYHLATVIDDNRAGISEVMRGGDILESTPLQIYLQSLLGLPNHDYLHLPIVVDSQGKKLSKQNLAKAVNDREPSINLFNLLNLLNQCPPRYLYGAPPKEILEWGIQTWDVSKLSRLITINETDQTRINTNIHCFSKTHC